MTLTIYKGYTIQTVGISRRIYRPGQSISPISMARVELSLAAAKRSVNHDIQNRKGEGIVRTPMTNDTTSQDVLRTIISNLRQDHDELADVLETLYKDLQLHLHGQTAPEHQQHIKDAKAVLHKIGRQL